jgi:UPF0755 protein
MVAKKKKSRWFRYFLIIVLVLLSVVLYKVLGPGTGTFTQGEYLYVHTGSNYEQLKKSLQEGGFVSDMFTFDMLARMAKLNTHVLPGKYKIKSGMSNYAMVRMLHAGKQEEVHLVIHKLRTKQDLINLVGTNLEADSLQLRQMLNDPAYLAQFSLDTNTAMCAIIPNTYFFKWNTTADKAFNKLAENYTHFWDSARKEQARIQGLTPVQAIIIASIVDEETNMREDKPKIASVYINRLKYDMKLQADPTIKFAVGDFTIRRVAGLMLQYNSPYNTYLYKGLPPGPICTPSMSTIEAVLEAPKTTYLYFCAKEDFSGYSNFASTYEEQIKNARAYQKALDARGIH